MPFRRLKKCLLATAIVGLIAPLGSVTNVEAQKEGAALWHSIVTVNRVKKPNRQSAAKLPSTQRSALLTLQWHLLQRVERGEGYTSQEVDSHKQFEDGDRLKLGITTNQDGYLYIVNQRPGKDSVLLFPDPRINGGLNRVLKNQEYDVPEYCKDLEDLVDQKDCWMNVGPPAGTETMIVIFSRDQITTLPNQVAAGYTPVKRSIVDALLESSRQKVEQRTGTLTIPNQKAVRFATRVQNINRQDNEELIATIVFTHGD